MVEALEASVDLDKFPKCVLEAYVVVLEAGSGAYRFQRGFALACTEYGLLLLLLGFFSTATSCASLALADSGVELFDLVAGSSSVS